VSGVSHGLGLGLGFSHIVELRFWHLQRPSLSLGWCYKFLLSQDVQLLLYFIHGLVSGVSHGLGLGLRFSHVVELWLWCLQGPNPRPWNNPDIRPSIKYHNNRTSWDKKTVTSSKKLTMTFKHNKHNSTACENHSCVRLAAVCTLQQYIPYSRTYLTAVCTLQLYVPYTPVSSSVGADTPPAHSWFLLPPWGQCRTPHSRLPQSHGKLTNEINNVCVIYYGQWPGIPTSQTTCLQPTKVCEFMQSWLHCTYLI